RLRYHAARREETTLREVEPLGLVFYLDQWHLIGWCRLREDVRDFRVDRIHAVEVSNEPAPPRPDFDLEGYIAQTWTSDPRQKAEIEVQALLLETVRRYWGPAILEEHVCGESVRMVFTHSPQETAHVARWLLSFGTVVRVIAPALLREEVVKQAKVALAHHGDGKVQVRKRS
ncbi:MAG TPA: WYL domain-containing protein, partial [Chthoniobacter sp.]|nr:WYL domain-containing protein [Chthoniobacter sp.]